jgi:hypothetical protein
MDIEDFSKIYLAKTDEELIQLAGESDELTSAAYTALSSEMSKRRINLAEHFEVLRDKGNQTGIEEQGDNGTTPPHYSFRVGQFITDVLHFYHNHFLFFVKLMAPAVVVGYVAIVMSVHEGREIARQIPPLEAFARLIEMLEIFVVDQIGYLVSWMAFCFSFGAICFAVRQIEGASSHRLKIPSPRFASGWAHFCAFPCRCTSCSFWY